MKIISPREVKRMTYEQRIRNYEMEKNELLSNMGSAPPKDYVMALEALREKWMV